MKHRSLALLVSLAILPGCSQSHDATLRKQVLGNWHNDITGGGKSASTYSPDGTFKCHVVFASGNAMDMSGTYEIKDGYLVETVTSTTPPAVLRFQIIHANDHELVVSKDGQTHTIQRDAP